MRGKALAFVMLLCGACHRHVETRPTVLPPDEDYCWWAVHRSPWKADTVAQHFKRAFDVLGLDSISSTRIGDTIWVSARARPDTSATFHSRAVAYWHGDSTHYRYYVQVVPTADMLRRGEIPSGVGFCGRIAQAAAIVGSTPREPTGDERLPVWTGKP